jgi:hypothetical protein
MGKLIGHTVGVFIIGKDPVQETIIRFCFEIPACPPPGSRLHGASGRPPALPCALLAES